MGGSKAMASDPGSGSLHPENFEGPVTFPSVSPSSPLVSSLGGGCDKEASLTSSLSLASPVIRRAKIYLSDFQLDFAPLCPILQGPQRAGFCKSEM